MATAAEQWGSLRRGVEAVVPEEEFLRKLERSIASGVPLRVKYGIDPTGIDVHLGHTVPLRKLRQFQDLGHTAVVIIGDYTAMVGDPSGRDETRAGLSRDQIEANARDYLKQVGRIVDMDRAEVHFNGEWFGRWNFADVLRLTQRTTIGQISARDDFAKRLREGKPVHLSECLYPLMQGWDSVEVRADVELGGTEQLFNLLVARDLQQEENQTPQVAMTMPILVGTDGVRRMGKSLGNYIGVGDAPASQFGKVMSLPDAPMRQYFTLLSDLDVGEIDRLLGPEVNPRDAKEVLGKTIVAQYHGPEAASAAADGFRDRAKTLDLGAIATVVLRRGPDLGDRDEVQPGKLLALVKLAATSSEGSRLVTQGGVWTGTDQTPLDKDRQKPLRVETGLVLGVGKGNKARAVRVEVVQGD